MKYIFISAIAIILIVLGAMATMTVPVSADGGVHNFNAANGVTQNCAGCHRAHTAIGPNLLKSTNAWDLCTSCHGANADLDVIDGLHYSSNVAAGSIRGGGFINAAMAISATATITGSATITGTSTSRHQVLGMPGYTTGITNTVWGIGPLNPNPNPGLANYTLQCSTCHDPHGKAGPSRTATYRILRCDFSQDSALTGAGVVNGNCVPDTTGSHNYVVNSTYSSTLGVAVYYGQRYSSTDLGTDNANMDDMSKWCSSCHTRIHTSDNLNSGASGPGRTSSGDVIFNYRHVTTGTSTEYNFGTGTTFPTGSPGCMTCHVSHGSDVVLTSNSAKTVPLPGTAEGGGQYIDTALMRISQRGVCEACHNK